MTHRRCRCRRRCCCLPPRLALQAWFRAGADDETRSSLRIERSQSVIAMARSAMRSRAESFSVALLSWPQRRGYRGHDSGMRDGQKRSGHKLRAPRESAEGDDHWPKTSAVGRQALGLTLVSAVALGASLKQALGAQRPAAHEMKRIRHTPLAACPQIGSMRKGFYVRIWPKAERLKLSKCGPQYVA